MGTHTHTHTDTHTHTHGHTQTHTDTHKSAIFISLRFPHGRVNPNISSFHSNLTICKCIIQCMYLERPPARQRWTLPSESSPREALQSISTREKQKGQKKKRIQFIIITRIMFASEVLY